MICIAPQRATATPAAFQRHVDIAHDELTLAIKNLDLPSGVIPIIDPAMAAAPAAGRATEALRSAIGLAATPAVRDAIEGALALVGEGRRLMLAHRDRDGRAAIANFGTARLVLDRVLGRSHEDELTTVLRGR